MIPYNAHQETTYLNLSNVGSVVPDPKTSLTSTVQPGDALLSQLAASSHTLNKSVSYTTNQRDGLISGVDAYFAGYSPPPLPLPSHKNFFLWEGLGTRVVFQF